MEVVFKLIAELFGVSKANGAGQAQRSEVPQGKLWPTCKQAVVTPKAFAMALISKSVTPSSLNL